MHSNARPGLRHGTTRILVRALAPAVLSLLSVAWLGSPARADAAAPIARSATAHPARATPRARRARQCPRGTVASKRHRGKRARACVRPPKHHPKSRVARAKAKASGGLGLVGLDGGSVRLSWPVVVGAGVVSVFRGGVLVDRFAGGGAGVYVSRGLWPGTSYAFSVVVSSAAGGSLATFSGSVSTPARSGAFGRLYADSAFVNAAVGGSPALDANSSAVVARSLAAYGANANLSNSDAWGIPMVAAAAQSPSYSVGCTTYWCDVSFPAVPIPAGAATSTGSDHHLAVMEPDGSEMDMWLGSGGSGGWQAGERWLTSQSGPAVNCGAGQHCGGADVAGFALAAGVIRPEEIAQGHIDHALAITTPYTRQGFVACPATNGDGHNVDPAALPIGAHVALDRSVDVSALAIPGWQKVIATALQQYGAYVVDTSGSLEVRGESNLGRGYDAWAKAGVSANSPSLAGLPWQHLNLLAMTKCA